MVSSVVRTFGSIGGSLLLFVLAAPLIYWTFYQSEPSGEAAFKTLFWTFFAAHMLVTFAGSILLARVIHAPVFLTVAVVVVGIALLALPLLWWLSLENACSTPWQYPFDLSC